MTSRPSRSIYADTLAVFDRSGFEPLTTPEVADALDAERRTVYQRLQKLVDRGKLKTKETGANSRVWWRPPAGSSPSQATRSETDFEREREPDRGRKWLRKLFDGAPDGILVHNVDGTILDVNETLVETIGYTRESLLSMDVTDIEVGVDANTLQEHWRSLESGTMQKLQVEGTHRRKDGSIYPVEVWVSRVSTDKEEQDQFVALIRDITERKERERELERQREHLGALNHLNEVVSGITEAVITQSTREEIEQVVCDQLAEFDSYQISWICAVSSDMNLERKAIAGIDGLHGELPPCSIPDTWTGQAPTTKSVRTQEMQILQHVLDDPDLEPYHESAREYGYRSLASIPVVHEDTLYGVIGLASERTDAFTEEEWEVVRRLGEIVGHAIAAVERKRMLLSDDVVELSFRMHNVEELGLPVERSGRVVFDRILPLGDRSYLEYGRATGNTMETVRALVDADRTPHSEPVNVIETSGDETRFELRLDQSQFLSAIVDAGGYIDKARIEDGEYSIRVHLPLGADVRRIVDVVTEAFPEMELITRRQTTRSDRTPQQTMQILTERLTDRQRAALEAAYFGGFFEWPRNRSGEEVADSLGIAASTFHQHVRKAEKKLLDVVFTEV